MVAGPGRGPARRWNYRSSLGAAGYGVCSWRVVAVRCSWSEELQAGGPFFLLFPCFLKILIQFRGIVQEGAFFVLST